MPSAKR